MAKRKPQFLKFFDPKMGLIGGLFMGTVVYIVNSEYGFSQAIIASLKQASYTFLAGGFLMRLCENLAKTWPDKTKSILLAVSCTTLLSAALTFGVHSLRGTPEPLMSTLITILFAVPGFTWWALRSRQAKA